MLIILMYLIFSGAWPVALVNGHPITFSEFGRNYNIAYHFYQSELKINNKDTSVLDSKDGIAELNRAVLDSTIENEIINEELNKILKPDDLNSIIDEKISKVDLNSDNFQKGAELLYGLSLNDFKQFVLVPKAKEQIMQGRLFSENRQLGDWLKEKKSQSRVVIFIPGLAWDGGGVVKK